MNLIEKIRSIEETEARIDALKDAAKGQTAYLITPGPTLTSHDREKLLEKLEGKLVIACKQAYDYVKEVATFHLLSCYSYQPYEYYSEDTIRHWQLTGMNIPNELQRIDKWNQRIDIMLPVYSTPWIQLHQSTAYTREFNNWDLYGEGKTVWGPGIMYESAFPLALHLGCTDIVTIGWDIGDLSKFKHQHGYKLGDDDWIHEHASTLYKTHAGAGPDYTELKETIECTKEMYDWFSERNINVRILSDTNPADKRFERITLEDL